MIHNNSAESPIITIDNIEKGFGIFRKRKILKGINLEIAKGKCIILMGENGIGKTISIRIICGLLSQNQGKISSKGKISYLPEVSSIYPYLTARESIDLF